MRAIPDFRLKRFFNEGPATTARANLSPSFAEPLPTPRAGLSRAPRRARAAGCGSCALAIAGALEELPGVEEARTDFARATMAVVFDRARVDLETISRISALRKLYASRPGRSRWCSLQRCGRLTALSHS